MNGATQPKEASPKSLMRRIGSHAPIIISFLAFALSLSAATETTIWHFAAEQRQQAEQIAAWAIDYYPRDWDENHGYASDVMLINSSLAPVYNIVVSWGCTYDDCDARETGPLFTRVVNVLPPGRWVLHFEVTAPSGSHVYAAIALVFKDSAGAVWSRDATGKLQNLHTTDPLAAAGISKEDVFPDQIEPANP